MAALEGNLFGRSGRPLRPFRTQPLNHRNAGLNRFNDTAPRGQHIHNYGAMENLEDVGGSFFRAPNFSGRRYGPNNNRDRKKGGELQQAKDSLLFDMPEDFSWRDNENDKAEREGKPPDDVYTLSDFRPEGFDEKFFGPRFKNLFHISKKTGAHLNMPRDPMKPAIEIWGNSSQIDDAKRDLKLLEEYTMQICRVTGKKASRTFEKIRAAPSYRKLESIRATQKEAARKKMLRDKPSPDMILPVTSYVIWPKEILPTTYFGVSLAALDPIRWDCNCFISWEPNNSSFLVQGRSQEDVLSAQQRIFGLYCEIAAGRRAPVKAYLVHPPSKEVIRQHVIFDTKHGFVGKQLTFDRNSQIGALPTLYGPPPSKQFLAHWEKERAILERANNLFLKRLVQQGIDDVYYARGNLKLKVNFGTLIMNTYKRSNQPNNNNKMDLEDFMESIHEENSQGELIRDVGGIVVASQIYGECLKRPDIFSVVNFGIDQDGGGLQYTIQCVFQIRLFKDDNQFEDCRLDVEFAQDSVTHKFNVWSAVWSLIPPRGQPGASEADKGLHHRDLPMSADVIDFDADIGWNIELSKYKQLNDTDIYPIFSEFLRLLKFEKVPDDSIPDTITDPPKVYRISYVNLNGMTVQSVTQKTKHQFWMGMSDYIFEVVKYEYIPTHRADFPINVPVSLTKDELQKIKIERRYGAGLYSYTWQQNLASQRLRPLGKGADWKPSLDTFFRLSRSTDGPGGKAWPSGWDEFMGRIQQCVEVIAIAKKLVKSGAHIAVDEEEATGEVWDRY